jgi:hypothetical protein
MRLLKSHRCFFLFAISTVLALSGSATVSESKDKAVPSEAISMLWEDPGDISSRDLYYGPGAKALAPSPPFIFIKEDKDGESPKFRVKDANGIEWSVKLGTEAQPETVVTRIVWAVGYFAEEAYYFDSIKVKSLPRLSRGRKHIGADGTARGARFEPRRKDVKRGDTWDWNKNSFAGTKELDGLKVLMVLLNNYDARKNNNRILIMRNPQTRRLEARYVVTDLGATLGKSGGLGGTRSKNDLEDFLSTRFVLGVKEGVVEFDYDTRPTGFGIVSVLYPPYYKGEVKKEKAMRGIPVEHAQWIGSLLSQLTDEQLRSAFRAAGYDEPTMNGYVKSLRGRIDQLTRI